jgi:hypothetical protein
VITGALHVFAGSVRSRAFRGWALLLVSLALVACGGQHVTPRPPNTDAGNSTTVADTGAFDQRPVDVAAPADVVADSVADLTADLGPDAPAIASTPPIAVPGVALWLDGNVNVTVARDEIVRWRDRSPSGHSFEVEAGDATPPRFSRIGAARHGAVRFEGRERLVARGALPNTWTTLTIGDQDFLLALVVEAESETQRRAIGFGLLDPIPYDLPGNLHLTGYGLAVVFDQTVKLTIMGPQGISGGALPAWPSQVETPRLLLLSSVGNATQIRLNGVVALENPSGRLSQPSAGRPAARINVGSNAIYVGSWDFDSLGIVGAIGEVVIVTGPQTAQAVAPIEEYLRGKYGL